MFCKRVEKKSKSGYLSHNDTALEKKRIFSFKRNVYDLPRLGDDGRRR